MNVIDIVKKSLIESGHDGLYNENYECACLNDELRPCGGDFACCIPGYKHSSKDTDYNYFIKDHKELNK